MSLRRCAGRVGSSSLMVCGFPIHGGLNAFPGGVLTLGDSRHFGGLRELTRPTKIGAVPGALVAILPGKDPVRAGTPAVRDGADRVAQCPERPTLRGIVSRFRTSVPPLREHIAGKRAVDHGVHVDLLHSDDRFPQLGIGVTFVGDAVALVRGQVSGVRRFVSGVGGEIPLST